MPIITPTITAESEQQYKEQVEKVAHVAHRLHIDLTDGVFAEHRTISPDKVWWPVGITADIHLMYQEPLVAVRQLLNHRPHLIIVHAESGGNFDEFVRVCRDADIKVGVALMPATKAEVIVGALDKIDHVMIFSGNLGFQGGGTANLSLLSKAHLLKQQKPELEIGWDGGVNLQNVSQLIFGGVDVINVGGYVQHAADPVRAFEALDRVAQETGTT